MLGTGCSSMSCLLAVFPKSRRRSGSLKVVVDSLLLLSVIIGKDRTDPKQRMGKAQSKTNRYEVSPASKAEQVYNNDGNVTDTVARARQVLEDQGPCEAEISYGGEADLHQHLTACQKNPGHTKFIPIEQFEINHLPARYRDYCLLRMIKALAELTVRVSVKYTSNDRPETYPDTDMPYPFYSCRGSDMMRTGSGWLIRVNRFPMWKSSGSCPCQECSMSECPQTEWAEIDIRTSAHVVLDNSEGAHTTCNFFYDNNTTDLGSVLTLTESIGVLSNIQGDWSTITYITHNLTLASRLEKLVNKYIHQHLMISKEYTYLNKSPHLNHSLAVVISHPHGCSKQVSIGKVKCTEMMKYDQDLSQYSYTTATCRGSSGAPVYVLGRDAWCGCDHPHSGHHGKKRKLNYSGVGYV